MGGGLCWEGMVAFRRLVLVIIATLVENVLIRHIGLAVACFFRLVLYSLLSFLLHEGSTHEANRNNLFQ